MLKAKIPDNITAWLMPSDKSIETSLPPEDTSVQPPAPGMLPLEFTFHDLSDDCTVRVDSHSGSPVFMQETRDLLFNLFKAGLVQGEELISRLHPPGEDAMIEDLKKAHGEGKICPITTDAAEQARKPPVRRKNISGTETYR